MRFYVTLRRKQEGSMARLVTILSLVLFSVSILACQTPEQKAEQYDKYYREGYALTQAGKDAEAISYYQKAIQALPNDAKTAVAYNNLGWSYEKTGQLEDAIKAYKKALSLNPNLTLAKNNLAAAESRVAQ